MEIHSLQTEAELAQSFRLTAVAWREAFDHILSPEELDGVEGAMSSDISTRFENLQEAPNTVVLVAEADEDIVGWLSTTRHPERTAAYARAGEADIRTLYVRPADWGAGVGTALLNEALERLPTAVDCVVLETFRENESGRAFYNSRGFEVREVSEHEVGENSYPTVVLGREV